MWWCQEETPFTFGRKTFATSASGKCDRWCNLSFADCICRLLAIPHISRIRFASKILSVSPVRIMDKAESWAQELIRLSNIARQQCKQVCLHTHINHPNEISWITAEAARYLYTSSLVVRNQAVVLRGVNDDIETMGKLIRSLADLQINPVSCLHHPGRHI